MKKAITVIMTIFFCFCLLSCASDVANRYYGNTRYPPKNSNEVLVLKDTPKRPYTVLADFQSRREDAEDMQRKAAQIGADAVIVTFLGGYRAHGQEWAGEDVYNNTYSHVCGTAIKWKD